MPLDLKTLADKVDSHKFDFAGEVVRIEYRPHLITPTYMARLQAMSEAADDEEDNADEQARSADAKLVAELLVSWDVMAGDEPYPPTYENLLSAPMSLVSRVAAEIVAAVGKLATPRQAKK